MTLIVHWRLGYTLHCDNHDPGLTYIYLPCMLVSHQICSLCLSCMLISQACLFNEKNDGWQGLGMHNNCASAMIYLHLTLITDKNYCGVQMSVILFMVNNWEYRLEGFLHVKQWVLLPPFAVTKLELWLWIWCVLMLSFKYVAWICI